VHNWHVQREPREEPELEVRPPVGGRITQIGIAGFGAWLALVVTTTLAARTTLWALLAGAALVVWLIYFYRPVSMVVVIRGDTLTVRNLLRTRHVSRTTVAEVTLGESTVAKAPNQTVVIKTRNGQQVRLEACARSVQSRRKRRRVEDFHRRVTDWCDLDPGNGTPDSTTEPESSTLLVEAVAAGG
jgi:hypothetical protein